jgi:hypothetical protein
VFDVFVYIINEARSRNKYTKTAIALIKTDTFAIALIKLIRQLEELSPCPSCASVFSAELLLSASFFLEGFQSGGVSELLSEFQP